MPYLDKGIKINHYLHDGETEKIELVGIVFPLEREEQRFHPISECKQQQAIWQGVDISEPLVPMGQKMEQ